MSGGIIIQRADLLLTMLNNPSYFNFLEPSDKARIIEITRRGAPSCDEGDVCYMSRLIDRVTHLNSP